MKDADMQSGQSEQRIQSLFENDLKAELCKLRTTFREPVKEWFVKTRDEIQRIRKDDETHYKQSIDILSRRMPELRSLIDDIETSGWHQDYRIAVVDACSTLPEKVVEEQDKDRFKSIESDSIRIKTGKLCKRIGKSIIRRRFKRTVYLRRLATEFLMQNIKWIEEFAAREYDEIAMLIDTLIAKSTPPETGNRFNADNIDTPFRIELLTELEDHLQIAVQHLKQFDENNKIQVDQLLNEIKLPLLSLTSKAGTFELRQPSGPKPGYDAFQPAAAERLEKQKTEWVRYLRSQLADLKVQAEIAHYGFVASSVKKDIEQRAHQFFRDTFYLPIEKGVEATKNAIQQLKELRSKSSVGVDRKLEKLRIDLEERLHEGLIRPMQDRDHLLTPIRQIQNLISDLQVESRRFSDELHLAKSRVSKYPVPELRMDTIRWQSLAARYLKEEVLKKMDPSTQKFDTLLHEILKEVEEAVQISDVNILAAIESGDSAKEDEGPLQIALDGLERAVNTLEKSIKQIREKQNAYQFIVKEKLPEAMHSLAQTMLNREFDRFEMQDKALMVKEQAVNWKQILTSKWAASSEKAEIGWRFFLLKFKGGFRKVTPYLGFRDEDGISIRQKRNLAEYLARPGIESDLPFIYKRLFDRDFSIDERFYIPPKNTMEMIANSYDQWKRGMSANVAIVGEKGSGKTTMIRFAKKEILKETEPHEVFFDQTFTNKNELLKKLCTALKFKQTDSVEEFLDKVEKKKTPSVLIVENLQNVFIRNINGYEALEAFWVIMSSTMDKIFWVVSSSRYSWDFFTKMSDADQYFSHIVYADKLDELEIKEAILSRHKSSGYELHFEPDDSLQNSRAYKKLVGDPKKAQELIRENYFLKLSKICEGNTSIAMIFWLQSIKEFDNQRFVFRPLEVAEVDKIEVPSREVLFTLAALVVHDTLNKEEVALALHTDLSESRLMLARLKTKGIVYASKSGYNLNHLVYRQVVRLLKRRNIIH